MPIRLQALYSTTQALPFHLSVPLASNDYTTSVKERAKHPDNLLLYLLKLYVCLASGCFLQCHPPINLPLVLLLASGLGCLCLDVGFSFFLRPSHYSYFPFKVLASFLELYPGL